jgi:hypothetical protein
MNHSSKWFNMNPHTHTHTHTIYIYIYTHTHTNFGPMGHIHFLDKSKCCDGQGIFGRNKSDHGNLSLQETKYQSTIFMPIPIFTQAITPPWTALILSIAELKWPPLKLTFQINCFTLEWLQLIKEGVMRLGSFVYWKFQPKLFCYELMMIWADDPQSSDHFVPSFWIPTPN